MNKTGKVLSSSKDKAIIQVIRKSACGDKCGQCSGTCESQGIVITAKNVQHASIGDIVEVSAETHDILKYTALLYLIPLFALISGILVSLQFMSDGSISELISFLIGLGLMLVSLLLISKYSRDKHLEFQVTQIIRTNKNRT